MGASRHSPTTLFAAIRREAASFVVLAALVLSLQALLPTIAAFAPAGTALAELCLGAGGDEPAGKVGHIGGCICGTACAHACCSATAAAPAIASLAAALRISARRLPSGASARRSGPKSAHRSRGPPLLS